MAQNITLLGASYSDVPAVQLPKTGGGTAQFDDTTDANATASDILTGKTAYVNGQKITGTNSGGTAAISVVDTADSHGGTVRTITALDISDTTAVASDVAQGKYFYTANGTKTAGTASGGGGGLTQHEIHLEFDDSTDTDIEVDYDNSLLGTMITAYSPSTWTYNNKTVYIAELDGVKWYDATPSPETWETVYNGTTNLNEDTPYNSWWISSLGDTPMPVGSVWRVTIDGVEYSHLTATSFMSPYNTGIGNPLYAGGSDDGSGLIFCFCPTPWGAWSGGADLSASDHAVKIERLVTS